MVTVCLRGGLGNQMFQYAAGLAVARKNDTSLVLDTAYLNDRFPRRQFTFRTYDLDIFKLTPRFTVLSKISSAIPVPGIWLGADLATMQIKNALGWQRAVKEKKEFVFDPDVLNSGKNVFLWGFWQTPKYFEGIADEVRAAFSFKGPIEGIAEQIAEDIQRNNSVSIHVRRTDYTAAKYVKTYGKTDLSYYDKAVSYIAERANNPKFYIFSDDIAWCKDNIRLSFPTVYVGQDSEGPKASYHLQLMALCKHNIIANSTFSWWGAWLNANSEKVVIAPKRWTAGIAEGEGDFVSTEWIRV